MQRVGLTKGFDLAVRLMRESRPPGNKDCPHQGVLVIVAVDAHGVVDYPLGLGVFQVHLLHVDKRPARLGNNPERGDALIFREMVALRHVSIAEVDFEIGVLLCLCDYSLVDFLEIMRVLWS